MAIQKIKPIKPGWQNPKNTDDWTKNQVIQLNKSKTQYNNLLSQRQEALKTNDPVTAQRLRGRMNAIAYKQQQNNKRQELSPAEKRTLKFQSQYLNLLGQSQASQEEQYRSMQDYYSQVLNQVTEYQAEQSELYKQILDEQKAAAELEKMRSDRSDAQLADQQRDAALFTQTRANTALIRLNNQRTVRSRSPVRMGALL